MTDRPGCWIPAHSSDTGPIVDLADGALNMAGTVLTVQTYTEFTDHSGRSNYVITDTFTRG